MILIIIALSFMPGRLVMGYRGYYLAGSENAPNVNSVPYYLNDPEPKPANLFDKHAYLEDYRVEVKGDLRLVGDIFAGRAEFPWIVDVRFDMHEDEELHATGNIIMRNRVLSSCRTVLYANALDREEWASKHPGKVTTPALGTVDGLRWSMSLGRESVSIKVVWCSNFLWNKYPTGGDGGYHQFHTDVNIEYDYEGGEGRVRHVAAHPKCEENRLIYDFAILALAEDVIPIPPTLTYIPAQFDEAIADMGQIELARHISDRVVCYVASFGRPYRNDDHAVTTDYKVKFRVYFTSMQECTKIWNLIGFPLNFEGIDKDFWCSNEPCKLDPIEEKNIMCFNTRALIGTVCDHDRGSPIVCDSKVHAFVTRGAEARFCSSAIRVPFLSTKISAIKEYFVVTELAKYAMPRTPRPDTWQSRRYNKQKLASATSAKLSRFILVGILLKILNNILQPSCQ